MRNENAKVYALTENDSGVGATLVGGFGFATRSLCQCGRSAEVQWDCAGDRTEWEKEMGTFSLGVSQVSAAKFSRMGRTLDCAVGLGTRLLPTTAPARQGPPCRGASLSFQM